MTHAFRQALIPALLALAVLAGCDRLGIGTGAEAPAPAEAGPITGEAIETTPLEAPAAASPASPAASTPQPAAETPSAEAPADPAPQAAEPAAEAPPPPPKPPQQIACEKKGGQWAIAGQSGIKTCLARTRDSGKRCTRGTQCQGECLARSNTCAPYTPLFGCNDILQDDGRRVTLCID